jgi:hypothetical protein
MRFSRVGCVVAAAAVLAVGLGSPAQADTDDDAQPAGTTVEVPAGAETGVPTGITLASGDSVTITATGTAQTNPNHPTTDPDGVWPSGGSASCIGIPETCLAQTTASALVGRVGNGDWTLVGSGPTTLTGVGTVWLAYNDAIGFFGDNSGGYTAVLEVTRAGAACADSAVRPPIRTDGSSVFRAGHVIPVRFLCAERGLRPTMTRQLVSATGDPLGPEVAVKAWWGSTFRHHSWRGRYGQYVYLMPTRGLAAGTYRLGIDLGNGAVIPAQISLR